MIPGQVTARTLTVQSRPDVNTWSLTTVLTSTSSLSANRKEMVVRTATQYLPSQTALYLSDH